MTNTPESDDAAIERLASSPTADWQGAVVDVALDTAAWYGGRDFDCCASDQHANTDGAARS